MRTESIEPQSKGIYGSHLAPTEHSFSTSSHPNYARCLTLNLEGRNRTKIRDPLDSKLIALEPLAK